MKATIEKIQSQEMDHILKIQTIMLKAIHDFMHSKEMIQLTPVIISPITDPLCHSVFDAKIKYYEQELHLTKSMILHKQVSLISPARKGIYIVSPNVRLEKEDCQHSGRHLLEFSQVDFEFKDAKKEDIMKFMEELIPFVFKKVQEKCSEELKALGRELRIPEAPFKVYTTKELEKKHGKDFEKIVSERSTEPFWILDHNREFYDKEDPEKPGTYLNYDMVWPEGFGEALSGGEREHEYEQILKRMKRRKMSLESFKSYLDIAKTGVLPFTAGGGFGVERMLRFICGKEHIKDVSLFPKVPGVTVAL